MSYGLDPTVNVSCPGVPFWGLEWHEIMRAFCKDWEIPPADCAIAIEKCPRTWHSRECPSNPLPVDRCVWAAAADLHPEASSSAGTTSPASPATVLPRQVTAPGAVDQLASSAVDWIGSHWQVLALAGGALVVAPVFLRAIFSGGRRR